MENFWVNSSLTVGLLNLFLWGNFFENSPTNFVKLKRNKAKDSVCGEKVLKYLRKSNTEKKIKIYVSKPVWEQICHSLERTNRSFGINFV